MNGLHRVKGLLIYGSLMFGVLVFHAYALHLDEEAQRDAREHIAQQQA